MGGGIKIKLPQTMILHFLTDGEKYQGMNFLIFFPSFSENRNPTNKKNWPKPVMI
jgi:hypothetical protein